MIALLSLALEFATASGWGDVQPDMLRADVVAALERRHVKYRERLRGKPPYWIHVERDDGWLGTLYRWVTEEWMSLRRARIAGKIR